MLSDTLEFVIERKTEDRRKEHQTLPPYMISEGMVLIDRRGAGDRRTASRDSRSTGAN